MSLSSGSIMDLMLKLSVARALVPWKQFLMHIVHIWMLWWRGEVRQVQFWLTTLYHWQWFSICYWYRVCYCYIERNLQTTLEKRRVGTVHMKQTIIERNSLKKKSHSKDFCQRKTAPRQKSPRQATSPPIQSVAPGGNDSVELLETEQQCINEAIAVVNANLELRVSIRWVVFVTLMSQSTERGRVRNGQFRNVTVRKC